MGTQGSQRTRVNALAREAFFAGLEVHKELGPGLLEKAYERALAHELSLRNLRVQTQVPLSLNYKGLEIQNAYFIDTLVEGTLVLEIKSVEADHDNHKAQLLTYLRCGGFPLGLLMNFKPALFKDGVARVANGP